MKKILLLQLTVLLFTSLSFAQSVTENVTDYMEEVRNGSYQPIPKVILNTQNEEELFTSLQAYTTDSLELIRSKAYYIYKRVGQRSESEATNQLAINQLTKAIGDKSSGISGNASEALSGFKKAVFTSGQKNTIANYIKLETPHIDLVLKLAGYLEITAAKAQINQISNAQTDFKNKWAAQLALARMGEQPAIDFMLRKLASAPITDNFIYDFVPDLIYTRQLEIFEFLERIIQSNEQNCQSADPDSNQKMLCGYRVMEYLAPVIENYPLPSDEFGDLQIDDYETALAEVREWFSQNETYVIKQDTF